MKQIKILLLLLSLIIISPLLSQESVEKTNITQDTNSPEKVQELFIKVSDVPEQSMRTLIKLKSIKKEIVDIKPILEIHKILPDFILSIESIFKDPVYQNLEKLNLRKLRKMQGDISVYLIELNEWNDIIKSGLELYESRNVTLQKESKLWTYTHLNANEKRAPASIQEHITSVIVQIEEFDNLSKKNFDMMLTDSNIIMTNILRIEEVMTRLRKNELIVKDRVFHKVQSTILDALSEESFAPMLFMNSFYEITAEKFSEAQNYFYTRDNLILVFLATAFILALFIGYFNYLYMKKNLFVKTESFYKKDFFFIKMPISTLIIVLVLAVVVIFLDRPTAVDHFLLLIILVPVFRILYTVVPKGIVKYIAMFLSLYTLFFIKLNTIGVGIDSRFFTILLDIALLLYLSYIVRNKMLEHIANKFINAFLYKLLLVFILLLIVSVFSNIYGVVLLSDRITRGVFLGLYTSLVFYTMYIVLSGYVVVILRRRISSASHMLDMYSEKIEKTTVKIIQIGMFLWWIFLISKQLSVYPYLVSFKNDILSFSFTIASTVVSIQAIVDFSIIIFGTWALSRVVITILNVEVFSRVTLPRGVPTAIKTTLNYLIVITGAIIALSSLGVTPAQFTLVFGALGVGIGFGLRNIIANFVSGIIMVFERPVQIGDTIEVEKTFGSVQSIGARSSTIKTFDGSEVIIPNADFISKEIVNWTLSDEHRRKIVTFKVDYDSDIEQVLSIMKDIATKHSDVLQDPKPLATFQGFGENYLEFKLYFWLDENLIVASSEVSIGIYKALKGAGIKMPMPKQEMYINNRDKEELL